jgi:hypothetical protein
MELNTRTPIIIIIIIIIIYNCTLYADTKTQKHDLIYCPEKLFVITGLIEKKFASERLYSIKNMADTRNQNRTSD